MVPWDWHYKIYFDEVALRSAQEMIDGLSSDERNICEETLAFYNSFYSFGIMIDCLEEKLTDQSQVERIIGKAWRDRDNLIYTPKMLEAYYRKRIGGLGLDADKTQKLENLLDLSFSGRQIRKEYWSYARKLFGSAFDEMVVQFDNDKYEDYLTGYKQEKISQDQETEFKAIYKKLARNSGLNKRFGENAIVDGSYEIEVKTGSCYGEWWDRDLLGGGRDKLVLYKNGAESNKEDLLYTAIHETYPGHGHFYNRIRNEKTVMDHGAMMLVEGWATYCEWNSLPSEYRDVTRHNAMTMLHHSYNYDADRNPEYSFSQEAEDGKSPSSRAISTLVNKTQYVGYIESYYLGALWLEFAIDRLGKFTPDGFLRMLQRCNKGEFFRLWLFNTWLLGGVIVNDHITEEKQTCWNRPDLVSVPEIICYSERSDSSTGIRIYANNIGCRLVLAPYMWVSSLDEMFQDYYEKSETSRYKDKYRLCLKAVSEDCKTKLKDLQWVMPLVEGSCEYKSNYCRVPGIGNETKAFVSLLDCSFIHTCANMINRFSRLLCKKKQLSKYERYQLAYYQSVLQSVAKPTGFLTNEEEIRICSELYKLWGISVNIETTMGTIGQAITMFSFLVDYQIRYEKDILSNFLTLFGIVVGMEAIYNLATSLFLKPNKSFNIGFGILILLLIGFYFVYAACRLRNRFRERKEFTEKTEAKATGSKNPLI